MAKDALARTLARFQAQVHQVVVPFAPPVEVWSAAEDILAGALPILLAPLHNPAKALIAAYTALPPDPLGQVFGQFDGHGWNMAFDHGAGRLNGIYDFADAGIGPRHRDFIYAGLTSLDLMARVIGHYAVLTGLAVDMGRVTILAGTHRLWELAGGDVADRPDLICRFADWVAWWQAG